MLTLPEGFVSIDSDQTFLGKTCRPIPFNIPDENVKIEERCKGVSEVWIKPRRRMNSRKRLKACRSE
jgi:hypothetical protein